MVAALKYRLFLCLPVLALLPLSLTLACGGSQPPEPKDEIAVVWEAWQLIDDSYADRDIVKIDAVVSAALHSMLGLSDGSEYPFFTEVGRLRGQTPPEVPLALTDVWRGMAVHQQRWPEIQRSDLAAAAIAGITAGLGDPWAVYLSAEAYPKTKRELVETLEGEYRGIGAMLMVENDEILMFPFQDTPAQKAGIEDGDVLLEVDGQPVADRVLEDIVGLVADPSASKVTLLTRRGLGADPQEIEVFRGSIDLPSVSHQLLPGGIGHVYVHNFRHNTGEQVFEALEALEQIDMLALILDLRSNPGGSEEAANDVAGHFLPPESLFLYTEDRQGKREAQHVREGLDRLALGELPLVILVNENTAGEAEVVAAVLRESGRAVLMGTETFGRSGGYDFVELADGSAIYMATQRWFTPSGKALGRDGLQPDFPVISQLGGEGISGESQFDEAYRYLNDQLPPFR